MGLGSLGKPPFSIQCLLKMVVISISIDYQHFSCLARVCYACTIVTYAVFSVGYFLIFWMSTVHVRTTLYSVVGHVLVLSAGFGLLFWRRFKTPEMSAVFPSTHLSSPGLALLVVLRRYPNPLSWNGRTPSLESRQGGCRKWKCVGRIRGNWQPAFYSRRWHKRKGNGNVQEPGEVEETGSQKREVGATFKMNTSHTIVQLTIYLWVNIFLQILAD
jgi:hypothetical protein